MSGATDRDAAPGPDRTPERSAERAGSRSTGTQRLRIGLRREVAILLPISLLLLAVLSLVTLLSYRGALDLLTDRVRAEAAKRAQAAARELAGATPVTRLRLRSAAPESLGGALVRPDGRSVVRFGEIARGGLLDPLAGTPPSAPRGAGPSRSLPDRVAGFAPLPGAGPGGETLTVRIDLAASALAGRLRSFRILAIVVVGIDLAILGLVVVFSRHLLAPFDALLARARQVSGGDESVDDEVAFLLSTFEKATEALAERREERTEDDLTALERMLAPGLASGLLLLDREGKVLALNPVGSEVLGLDRPVVGFAVEEALARHPPLVRNLTAAMAEEGGMPRQECDLGERTLGLSVHPLKRDDGEVRGFFVLFADLTRIRQRAQEQRLEESLAQLGELAGGLAHEMRNSLAALTGYLTLIDRRPGEESVDDYLGEIRHEAEHLERVVDDFLAFARPGSVRPREVDLGRLVRRAMLDPRLAEAEVGMREEGGPFVLSADPQLLERALRNLLHNAVEAEERAAPGTRKSAGIEVSLRRVDGAVEIAVADRGPGIDPDMRDRLFLPFATGRSDGVGLGLALAHRIVTLHGGQLRLDDRAGGGARAVVSLPIGVNVT